MHVLWFKILISIQKKILLISGGNQRDLARAKNQKKLTDMKKGVRTDNLTVEQRKARYVQSKYTRHIFLPSSRFAEIDSFFFVILKCINEISIQLTDLLNKVPCAKNLIFFFSLFH